MVRILVGTILAVSKGKYTLKQIDLFKKALDEVNYYRIPLKYIHLSASNGILNYEDLQFTNMVRPGLIMYGYESFKDCHKIIDTKPICKLKSTITFIMNCLFSKKK